MAAMRLFSAARPLMEGVLTTSMGEFFDQ
jgi:hypothetical protein